MVRSVALASLNLLLLPLGIYVLVSSFVLQLLVPRIRNRQDIRGRGAAFRPKTILLTGVSTPSGLALARLFYRAGHIVIAADHQPHGVPVHGRFSKAIKRFYPLPSPCLESAHIHYMRDVLNIIGKERAHLWISCVDFVSPEKESEVNEMIEKVTDCRGFRLDNKTTSLLCNETAFLDHVKSLDLPTPRVCHVTSRDAVHKLLGHAERSERFYITEKAKATSLPLGRSKLDLLPRRSISQTYQHVSQLPISDKQPFVLQQHVEGARYEAQALIIRGVVEAFVASPVSILSAHLEPLSKTSVLCRSMLRFTQELVSRGRFDGTGHLSITFLVEERVSEKGSEQSLLPIKCSPSTGNIGVLLQNEGGAIVEIYLRACGTDKLSGFADSQVVVVGTDARHKYYWIGHDLVALVIYPLLLMLKREMSIGQYFSDCWTFIHHLLFWKEAMYEVWDPLPWWWQYHVYWPLRILTSIVQGAGWYTMDEGKINIS